MWDLSQSPIRGRCEIKRKVFLLILGAQPEKNLVWIILSWLIDFASFSNVILKYSLTQNIYKFSRLLFSALLTRHYQNFVFIKNRQWQHTLSYSIEFSFVYNMRRKILWNKYIYI